MKNKSLVYVLVLLAFLVSVLSPLNVQAKELSVQSTAYNSKALQETIQVLRNMAPFTTIVEKAKQETGMPYNNSRGKIRKSGPYGPWHYEYGVCTDAIIDSYVGAGVVSWSYTGPSGWNLRWVPNMTKYFKQNQVFLGISEPWLPGDVVFYAASNEKDDNPGAHVSIVIAVDDNGRPTRIINAGGKTAGERVFSMTMANLRVTRHGRLSALHNTFLSIYNVKNNYYAIHVSQAPYPTVFQGQSISLWASFGNRGAEIWKNFGPNPVRLGTTYPNNNQPDYPSPFACPNWIANTRPTTLSDATINPGGNGIFTFKICVPSTLAPGKYRLSIAPLVEGITWMFEPGVMVFWDITVVATPTPTKTDTPTSTQVTQPITITPTFTQTPTPTNTPTGSMPAPITVTVTPSITSSPTPTATVTVTPIPPFEVDVLPASPSPYFTSSLGQPKNGWVFIASRGKRIDCSPDAAHLIYTQTNNGVEFSWARWTPPLPYTGNYAVYVYIPKYEHAMAVTSSAKYQINYSGGSTTRVVDQNSNQCGWVHLGTFPFIAGTSGNVYLDNNTNDGKITLLAADAIKFVWVP